MDVSLSIYILLGLSLLLVCAFEFINGFHDTANAVAPVIYTKSLSPMRAVLLAAFFNFLGVSLGGIAVAMGIIHLLPLDIIANQPIAFGVSVVLSLLIAAIIWNFGTWYLGIPASSSHTLIGSILWVSLAMYYIDSSVVIPTTKVIDTFKSLLISPVIGFLLAFGAMHALHLYVKNGDFFQHPGRFWNKYPKTWIKTSLIGSSIFVSFAHGSNDGQKWVGLAMLILISLLPASFAINPHIDIAEVRKSIHTVQTRFDEIDLTKVSESDALMIRNTKDHIRSIEAVLGKDTIEAKEKVSVRKHILKMQKDYKVLSTEPLTFIPKANAADVWTNSLQDIADDIAIISSVTDYAPWWVIAMISISLGLGTMIGWKRIVITIGEKIGKEKLSYAQGTVSSLMTAATISSASHLGLPVSTTHILSSGVAGTMAHEHGKWGLQGGTIKSILMAWVLTLPISTLLAAVIFLTLNALFV